MKTVFVSCIFTLIVAGCKDPKPRYPLSIKTATAFEESITRNQQILASEKTQINQVIAKDSFNVYHASANGFWYCYNKIVNIDVPVPKENDRVTITYHLRTLANDTIYTQREIGKVTFTINRNAPFKGLNDALQLMKEGETITFLFPSYMAYGYQGDGRKIGRNIPLVCTIFLEKTIQSTKNQILN